MLASDLVAQFRDEMSDDAEPYLWSDLLVYGYADEAQKMFCRLTEGIEDATTVAITQLDIVPTAEWYALDPRVLKLRWVNRADTGREIRFMNGEQFNKQGLTFLPGITGQVQAIVSGLTKGQVRAWPYPNETVTLQMAVFRLPLYKIDINLNPDIPLEIDDQHQRSLLLWMKALAYRKQDTETFDKSKSSEFEASFNNYCEQAKREQERLRRVPGLVAYGGLDIGIRRGSYDYNNRSGQGYY